MARHLLVLFASTFALSAGVIDVSSEEFIDFRNGTELQMEYPFPDLTYLNDKEPTSLYWSVVGRQPSLPIESYESSATLRSIDGSSTTDLGKAKVFLTTICYDFLCTSSEPGISFDISYEDAGGIAALVGTNTTPGLPALWLIVRNDGPGLKLGIPGVRMSGFALTWGADGYGATTAANQFLLSEVPEPSTALLILAGAAVLAIMGVRRTVCTTFPS